MKRRRFYIDGFMRRAAGFVMVVFVVLILGKGILMTGLLGSAKQALDGSDHYASVLLGWLWKQQYPVTRLVSSDSGKERSKEEGTVWWLDFLWRGNPWYRYLTEKEEPEAYAGEDPAYVSFMENKKFISEHEYLFRYGGEDTNADGTLLAEADGETVQDTLADIPEPGVGVTPVHTVKADMKVLGTQYVKEQLADYDFLMKHFYSVHSSTTAGRDLMNSEVLLNKDFALTEGNDKPQILIYHTHSQETFADYGPDNPGGTVVGIGNYLTDLLRAKGYNVIHDTTVYDLHGENLDRNKAYTYALEGITQILQNNPSIQVVLDVHRDGVKEGYHMVSEVNGKQTAPIMFFNGMSQTPEGQIEYLQNPYREDNLAFSLQMQLDAAAYYPGLTRKIYLKGLRYNLHLRPRSALIEVGAQTNTYQEALNAMEPLSELLDMVLQGN